MELVTEDTYKGACLSDIIASAQGEMVDRLRAYPTGLGLVREMAKRVRESLYDADGQPRALPSDEEAVWREAFEQTFPDVAQGVGREAALVGIQNDLIALEDPLGARLTRQRSEQLVAFLTPLCVGFRKLEDKAKEASGWGQER